MKKTLNYIISAQKCSDLAKTCYSDSIKYSCYAKKTRLIIKAMKRILKYKLMPIACCNGIVYFETPVGQISFHYFEIPDWLETYFIKEYHGWNKQIECRTHINKLLAYVKEL